MHEGTLLHEYIFALRQLSTGLNIFLISFFYCFFSITVTRTFTLLNFFSCYYSIYLYIYVFYYHCLLPLSFTLGLYFFFQIFIYKFVLISYLPQTLVRFFSCYFILLHFFTLVQNCHSCKSNPSCKTDLSQRN